MFCKQIKGDCDKKEIIVLRFGWELSLSSHYSSLLYRVKIPKFSFYLCVWTIWHTLKNTESKPRSYQKWQYIRCPRQGGKNHKKNLYTSLCWIINNITGHLSVWLSKTWSVYSSTTGYKTQIYGPPVWPLLLQSWTGNISHRQPSKSKHLGSNSITSETTEMRYIYIYIYWGELKSGQLSGNELWYGSAATIQKVEVHHLRGFQRTQPRKLWSTSEPQSVLKSF